MVDTIATMMGVTSLVLCPMVISRYEVCPPVKSPKSSHSVDRYTKQNVGGGGRGIVTMDQGGYVTWREIEQLEGNDEWTRMD